MTGMIAKRVRALADGRELITSMTAAPGCLPAVPPTCIPPEAQAERLRAAIAPADEVNPV